MQYIEEKAHPDIKLGLHDNKVGLVCSCPLPYWMTITTHEYYLYPSDGERACLGVILD